MPPPCSGWPVSLASALAITALLVRVAPGLANRICFSMPILSDHMGRYTAPEYAWDCVLEQLAGAQAPRIFSPLRQLRARRHAALIGLLAGILAQLATPALAAGTATRGDELQEIIVTGRQPAVERIATVYQVDQDDIEARGARTLDEAIELLPGVNVRTGGNGSPRIDVRGYRTRHVKLLLNGVPFGDTFDGQFDPTLIPADDIARVKLTTGASSTLYGDGAIGAVINVITRQGGEGHAATTRTEYGSGDHYRLNGSYSWGDERSAVFVSGGRQSRRGFPLAGGFDSTNLEQSGLRNNSDRERNHGYFNVYRELSPSLDVGATLTYAEGAYGAPGSVVDDPADPFANRPRWQRVDDQEILSAQVSVLWDPEGPWSNRTWAYLNTLDENINRYSDPFSRTLADASFRGTFTDDAHSRVFGVHEELRYDHPFGGAVTVMLDGRQEHFVQDCLTRDIPVPPPTPAPTPIAPAPPVPGAPPVTLATATGATLNFNYLSTNNFGATAASGANQTIARLNLANNASGGVDFSLASLDAGNFFVAGGSGPPVPDTYVSRLYFLPDPTLDIGDWSFVFNPATQASTGGAVNFSAPGGGDIINNYSFRSRVGWQRPGGGGGGADPLFDGETALWSITNTNVAELLGFQAVSTGGRPNAFAAIELRQVDANGFWGASEPPTGGPGGLAVFLVAPTSSTTLTGPTVAPVAAAPPAPPTPVTTAPIVNVPPAGNACGSGGDGSGGGTPTRYDVVTFALRPFSQDRTLEVATTAIEASFQPWPALDIVVGYARHWLQRDDDTHAADYSYSTGLSYPLRADLRLRGGVGRKVRMPSVQQLYDTLSGDPELAAETSMTYESGLDYSGIEWLALGLTLFRSDVRNFIDRDPLTETFANNQRYRFQGTELTASSAIGERTSVSGSYSYLDASDRGETSLRDELQYRPRHKGVVQTSYRLQRGPVLTATAQHVSGEFYFARQGLPQTRSLNAYTLVNLRLAQTVTACRCTLYAGADNLFDENYEEAVGLPQSGRFIYGGIEFTLF